MKNLLQLRNSPLISQLAFYSLLASGTYIILLSTPHVFGKHFGHYTKTVIYLFPWLMLWLAYSWQVVTNREHRLEITLIVSIIILGIANTIFSDSLTNSLEPMRIFLLTGIFALWSSLFLLSDRHRRQVFDWFCAGALAVIALVETGVRLVQGPYGDKVFQIFTNHPIPLGTLLILLSPGPIRLIVSKNPTFKPVGWLLVLWGILLIYLTHKRGAWIALAAMLAMGMVYLARRRKYLAISLLVVLALLVTLQAKHRFARLDPKIHHDVSILERLELYHFALHVWQSHPFLGIGLRSFSQGNYLVDYHLHNKALHNFSNSVKTLHTFDNMALTALVELGSGMTLLYAGLIILILVKYCRRVWSAGESSTLEWYRVLVLLGFAIHSLSYDSLLFPPVNWMFHVQLGLMAGFAASKTGSGLNRRTAAQGLAGS